jgi:hypothetical protein|tara:strand:+ start:1160 stop:1369 length:210 start_codon:yes stop_codon:yes gene_type:complete
MEKELVIKTDNEKEIWKTALEIGNAEKESQIIKKILKIINKLREPIKNDKASGEYRILEILEKEISKND